MEVTTNGRGPVTGGVNEQSLKAESEYVSLEATGDLRVACCCCGCWIIGGAEVPEHFLFERMRRRYASGSNCCIEGQAPTGDSGGESSRDLCGGNSGTLQTRLGFFPNDDDRSMVPVEFKKGDSFSRPFSSVCRCLRGAKRGIVGQTSLASKPTFCSIQSKVVPFTFPFGFLESTRV